MLKRRKTRWRRRNTHLSRAPETMSGRENFTPLPGPGEQYKALPGVPEYFVHVIGDVERGKLPFIWTLQKNVDGFSLLLKLPAKSPKRRRRHLESAQSKDTSSRKQDISAQDHVKSVPRAFPDKEPTRATVNTPKRKSPSCKQRDRNRRRRWKRKKKSPRSLDTNVNVQESLTPAADTNRRVVIKDSDHETVQENLLPSADSNQREVKDCLSTESEVSRRPTVISNVKTDDLPCLQLMPNTHEDDYPPLKFLRDAGPDWAQPHPKCDECAYCGCGLYEVLQLCTRCETFVFCSRDCLEQDWNCRKLIKSRHREFCKNVQDNRCGDDPPPPGI